MINNKYVLIVDDTSEIINLNLKLFNKDKVFIFVNF